jgi:hypothetical protein
MSARLSGGRIGLATFVGFFIASNLNWAIATFLLNPWAMPLFDGFMRTGDDGASGLNIAKMALGFLPALLVSVSLLIVLPKPEGCASRAIVATLLVCFPAFFGTYTFLSGWGDVNWVPLMGAAVADTLCIGIGTLVSGLMLRQGLAAAPLAAAS